MNFGRDVGQITTLKSLDLSGTMVSNAGLAHLQGLKHLEDLSVDETQFTQEGLSQLEPLQSLREIRCYLDRSLGDEGAVVVSRLKSLRRLTTFLELTENGVAALATLPHLESVDLRGEGITDAALAHVGRMTSLKSLDLNDCPVSDVGLAELAALENLEYLGISDTRITSRGTFHLQSYPKLNRLRLVIDDDSSAKDLVIPNLEFIGGLSQLKSLHLSIPRLTDRDLAHVANLHDLEELFLEGVPVGDAGAFYLSGLASLTQLSLEGSVITDDGLTLLTKLHRLTYLNLDGHFTDKGISHLAKIKSLQNVYLSSPYLTDEGVAALAAAVPSIMSLSHSRSSSPLPEVPEVSYRDYDTFRREGLEADRTDKNALERKPPPPWKLTGWVNTDPDGLTLGDLSGKIVLVDFWGTWCGPCRAAMPKLKVLHEKYPNDLVILGIHTSNGAEQMADYVAAEKIPWSNACDVDKQTVTSWHVDSYPDVYLIDRNGILRVADLYTGDLERTIHELVAETSDDITAETTKR